MKKDNFEIFKQHVMPSRVFDKGFLLSWRMRMNLTCVQAADILGVSITGYHFYEKGRRGENGKDVRIPFCIMLSCLYYEIKMRAIKKLKMFNLE